MSNSEPTKVPHMDVCLVNTYISVYLYNHRAGCYDDMIFETFQMMKVLNKIPQTMSRMVWSAILFGDLVQDAGLLHPTLVPDFIEFKSDVFDQDRTDGIILDNAFCDFVNNGVDDDFDERWHWFVSILTIVMKHFHSFVLKPVVSGTVLPPAMLVPTSGLIHSRMISRQPRMLSGTTVGGATGGILTDVPDFRLCFLMDFACIFGDNRKTEVIGVAQPSVNCRNADVNTMKVMDEAMRRGNPDAIERNIYMFSGARSVMFYGAEAPLMTNAGPNADPVVSNDHRAFSIHGVFNALGESRLEGSRFARSICVEDALRFAVLWCSERVCKDRLLARNYVLDFTTNESGPFTLKRTNGDPIALSDDDPNTVLDIILGGFDGSGSNFTLERRTVGVMQRDMLMCYINNKYKINPRITNSMNYGIQSNTRTGLSDKIGMIWLINLASHRVRIGATDGKHRFLGQLMSMCGSSLDYPKPCPWKATYSKNIEAAQLLVESDFVFHQVNGCHPTRCIVSSQASLLATIKNEYEYSHTIGHDDDPLPG